MLDNNVLQSFSGGAEERADEAALAQLLDATFRFGEKIGLEHPESVALVTQTLAEQTRAIVPVAIRLPERARRVWRRLCEEGWAGRTNAVHAAREELQKDFERKFWLITKARHTAQQFAALTGTMLPDANRLQEAEEELHRLHAEIFGRWQTLEDLEDLLAARYPLPDERLQKIGTKHQPPESWYSEEEKPF
jgi:hypothetical protein